MKINVCFMFINSNKNNIVHKSIDIDYFKNYTM